MSRWRLFSALSLAGKARQSFEQAVELDGSNIAALSDLLEFYREAPGAIGGGMEKAAAIADRIAKLNPAAGERAWASIHEKKGEYEQAEARLRKAMALQPDNVDHVLSLASFLSRRGRFDESDRLYAKALTMAPDSPQVWFSRAKALVRSGRNVEEARQLLEKYMRAELAPDAEPRSSARELLKEI
jgi:tetratricopeptide (TPR) repeat protein